MRVAVIGGGITGLAAAWELRADAEVTVFEPGVLGGRVRTSEFEGRPVDEGPDAFLTRVPGALQLCQEIGIADELVPPAAGKAMLMWRGRLRPFPEGLILGAPRRLAGLATSGILSPVGVARAALDLVLPRRRPPGPLSVRDLVADRFGGQVADRLVDPLIGGIHAGPTEGLGAAEVAPVLVDAAAASRSLLLGLRRLPAPPPGSSPFRAPRRGMGAMVAATVRGLRDAEVRFEPTEAGRLHPARSGPGPAPVEVPPDPVPYDAVVVATDAATAAGLVGGDDLGYLRSIETASVVVVTMGFPAFDTPAGVSGFLVPRSEGTVMTACSFLSAKWPQASGGDRTLVRISAGRAGSPAALGLGDEELVGRLTAELGSAVGRRGLVPGTVRVSRWPSSFPQYRPGHADRIAEVEAALRRRLPNVALAGSSYHGAGVPACIASGRRAARLVRAAVVAAST